MLRNLNDGWSGPFPIRVENKVCFKYDIVFFILYYLRNGICINFVFFSVTLASLQTSFRVCSSHIQTCQPLIKENLETHEKKSGDSIKNSEILFFSRSRLNKPLFHRGKSLTVYLNVLFVFPVVRRCSFL